MLFFLFLPTRRDLVRVEATVIEKTESWPKIHMKFKKRKNYKKKKSKLETAEPALRSPPAPGVTLRPATGHGRTSARSPGSDTTPRARLVTAGHAP